MVVCVDALCSVCSEKLSSDHDGVRCAASKDDRPRLLIAAIGGDAEEVAALLAEPGIDVNASDEEGAIALIEAVRQGLNQGHAEQVVAALLASPSIDVNAATREGHTALIKATGKDYTEIVAALLASPGIERRMWAESRE